MVNKKFSIKVDNKKIIGRNVSHFMIINLQRDPDADAPGYCRAGSRPVRFIGHRDPGDGVQESRAQPPAARKPVTY